MRHSRYRAAGMAVLGILATMSAYAADVGTSFTYQGQLTDNGNPAQGPHDFEFRLFDADVGGTQIGGPWSRMQFRSTTACLQPSSISGRSLRVRHSGLRFPSTPRRLRHGKRSLVCPTHWG
jgi:hypothetical protein